jgi:hypothetical protein
MRDPLASWPRRQVGRDLLLVAPAPARAHLRVRAGLPRRPLVALAAELAEGWTSSRPPRRFSTAEGEAAASFAFTAGSGERVIVFVVGDHEITAIDGTSSDPAVAIGAIVDDLADRFTLGLGPNRWREHVYAAPPSWHRRARHLAMSWYAENYPRDDAVITVFHARPIADQAGNGAQHVALYEHLPGNYARLPPFDRGPVGTRTGLEGETMTFRATIDGVERCATNVALTDGQWLYFMRLDTRADQRERHAPTFASLVDSVEALAPPRMTAPVSTWTE